MKAKDFIGRKVGLLSVIAFTGSREHNGVMRRFWLCRCDCGNEREYYSSCLTSGNLSSCGCIPKGPPLKHGRSKSPEYRVWIGMRNRCHDKKNSRYADYGGRGIGVCARWASFENFFEDMGERPTDDHSIDRVDNNGNYEPGNCRWATRSVQQHNKRRMFIPTPPTGDDHWTRKDPERARAIGRRNIVNAHGSGERNNNAKVNREKAEDIRRVHAANPSMPWSELGAMFGIKREQTRKIVKGLAWL